MCIRDRTYTWTSAELRQLSRGESTDWQDAVTQNGSFQNYNLSISGGGKTTTHYLGLDYYDQQGTVKRSSFNKFTCLLYTSSYYRGEYGVSYLRRVRYGAGACYDRGPVVLRGEWIGGETGLPAGDERPAGGLLESSGWYVPVSYTHLDVYKRQV